MMMWPSAIIQCQKHPPQFLQEEPAAITAAIGVVVQQKEMLCKETTRESLWLGSVVLAASLQIALNALTGCY